MRLVNDLGMIATLRITIDLDTNQIKKIFDVLREETPIFKGYSSEEVASLQNVFKVL